MTEPASKSDQNVLVGIDFGTTKTMVASYDAAKKSPKPLTMGRGKFEQPTSMYATEAGDLLFGDEADDEGITDLPNHIRRFKMKLGKPGLAQAGRKSGTAQQLTAEFLAHLKHQLEGQVFHRSVERVILTVPAMFGPAQRHDLTAAARQAGFSHVELLEEPVAAGIAYCDQQSNLSKQLGFMVVDWGGGTFDVAHLERFASGEIKVHGDFVVGLDDIGGEVFDDELWSIASNALASAGCGTLDSQPRENWGRYRRQLSSAKETLSSQSSVSITFSLTDGRPAKVSLSRDDFNNIIRPMIQRAASFVSQLIVRASNTGCPPEFILLAGGTSRIPLVGEELERLTGVKCRQWIDGREAIALGAAIRANQLWGNREREADTDKGKPPEDKFSAMEKYRKLLEGAFIGGKFTEEKRLLLAEAKESLGLTLSEAHSLQIQILGLPIGDVLKSEDVPPSESRYAKEPFSSAPSQPSKKPSLFKIRLEKSAVGLQIVALAPAAHPEMKGEEFLMRRVQNQHADSFREIFPDKTVAVEKMMNQEARKARPDKTVEEMTRWYDVSAAHQDMKGEEFIRRTHFQMAYLVSLENASRTEVHSVRVSLKSAEGKQHSILIPLIKPGKDGALLLTSADLEGWMVRSGDTLTVDVTGIDASVFVVTEAECEAVDQKKALNDECPCVAFVRKAAFSSNFVLKIMNTHQREIKITKFQSSAGNIKNPIVIAAYGEIEIGWCELSGGRNLAAGEEFSISFDRFREVTGVIAEGKLKGNGAVWKVLATLGGIAVAAAGG